MGMFGLFEVDFLTLSKSNLDQSFSNFFRFISQEELTVVFTAIVAIVIAAFVFSFLKEFFGQY